MLAEMTERKSQEVGFGASEKGETMHRMLLAMLFAMLLAGCAGTTVQWSEDARAFPCPRDARATAHPCLRGY